MTFSSKLLFWYSRNMRELPWRNTTNPFHIWLSEIILQQTRVEQGLPYYESFINEFSSVQELADASLEDIYKLWEGLGYYSRARNLHAAAKQVVNEFEGEFPNNYSGLIKLKGVGDYTASAIASFCFNEPKPVLDGNVFRLISRIYGVDAPINKVSSRSVFKNILEELIDKDRSAEFNQAIMEFGALQCTPKKPNCLTCPFQTECFAFNNKKIEDLPVKEKAKKSKNRYFNYLIVNDPTAICVKKRDQKDIWQNLYEFPLIESKEIYSSEVLQIESKVVKVSQPIKHVLSHQNIYAKFYLIDKVPNSDGYLQLSKNELNALAFPRLINRFLENSDWI